MTPKEYKNLEEQDIAFGKMNTQMHILGDYIAKKEKYQKVSGINAVYFYLIQTYHWKPSDVYAMKMEDIRFVLSEYIVDWRLPEQYR